MYDDFKLKKRFDLRGLYKNVPALYMCNIPSVFSERNFLHFRREYDLEASKHGIQLAAQTGMYE